MRERLDHLDHDEDDRVEVAPLSQFPGLGGDRKQEGAVQTHGEVLGSVRPVRNLGEQQMIKLRVADMDIDHRCDHGANQALER
jgi:hypothetical protein